jgi:hypothetical protein
MYFFEMNISIIISLVAVLISGLAYMNSRKANIASRKPQLVFLEEWYPLGGGGNLSRFYLTNIGFGPAFNIDIPGKYINQHWYLKEFRNLPRNVSPNGRTLFVEAAGNIRFITQELILEVVYEDYEGRKYRTELKNTRHTFHKG